jgi:hypothetical protein
MVLPHCKRAMPVGRAYILHGTGGVYRLGWTGDSEKGEHILSGRFFDSDVVLSANATRADAEIGHELATRAV